MDKMIVYEDNVLLIVHKPAGIATETARVGQADLVSELKNYRKKKGEDTYIGVIHRLDQPVEGLLVFAKDSKTAKNLNAQLAEGTLNKKYAALVAGVLQAAEGEMTDYLLRDGRTNLSRVVPGGTKNAKEASLRWRVVQHNEDVSLLEIELYSGRHHQIRVQMAHAGYPLLGDFKYGSVSSKELSRKSAVNCTALMAYRIGLTHPVTGERIEFSLDFSRFTKVF